MAGVIKGPGRPAGGQYMCTGAPVGTAYPVPSVSEVLGRYKNSDGLIRWAARVGSAGMAASKIEATGVGGAVHDAIELTICGGAPAWGALARLEAKPQAFEMAARAFKAWLRWWGGDTTFSAPPQAWAWIETEMPYVSARHRFGGTLDALAVYDGCVILLDWKTSKYIGFDYVLQAGAYATLVAENSGEYPRRAIIVRADKRAPRERKGAGALEACHMLPDELRWASKCFLRLARAYHEEQAFKEHLGLQW